MARTLRVAGYEWTHVKNGEANHWTCNVDGTQVDVYSDYHEQTWEVMFSEEGCYGLKAIDLESAMKEAIYDLTH